MAIKITDKNEDKISAEIAAAAGRKKAFVHDAYDIASIAERAENRLEEFGLPRAHRAGATAVSVLAGPARSYRYTAEGTEIHMTRRATGWFLDRVEICSIFPGSSERLSVRIDEKQRAAAQTALMRDLYIAVR